MDSDSRMDIYADASREQLKFWDALAQYPRFNMLWSVTDRSVDEEAALWKHQNTEDFAFDLIDACGTLDSPSRDIIADWVQDPYLP